jgi:hypothetical protein
MVLFRTGLLFMAFVAPIQGFVNGLLYFNSRIYSQYQVVLTNDETIKAKYESGSASAVRDSEPEVVGAEEPAEAATQGAEETGVKEQVIHLESAAGAVKADRFDFALTDIMDPCYVIAFEEDEEAKYDIVDMDKKRLFQFRGSLDRCLAPPTDGCILHT